MICIDCEGETTDPHSCERCGAAPHLDGRYEIEAVLGRGANGTTYRARELATDQLFAVKELLVRSIESLDAIENFEREADVLRQLDHVGVPDYHEHFHVEQRGTLAMYIVQELIVGRPLSERLAEGCCDRKEAFELAAEVAKILRYLHSLSPPVVHRDIKPSNLMERRRGGIVLIDFGTVLDAVAHVDDGAISMAGTVGFMAPEQMVGRAGPASDIYALGMTIVALLTGEAQERLGPPDLDALSLPREARVLLKEMLARQADVRPTAAEVAQRARTAATAEEDAEYRAMVRANDQLARFPPAPRGIPDTMVFRKDRQGNNAKMITGAFVAVTLPMMVLGELGLALALMMALPAYLLGLAAMFVYDVFARKDRELYRTGDVAVATVLSQTKHSNGKSTYWVLNFSFQVDGKTLTGFQSMPSRSNMANDERFIVIFPPGKPDAAIPLSRILEHTPFLLETP